MSDNLAYFKSINANIHPLAEEVTILNGHVEENLFDIKTVPQEFLMRFVAEIGAQFGLGVELSRLQQLSFQAADGVRYFEDKLMAVYSGGKERCADLGFWMSNPHDDYCVNYFLNSKQTQVKFYDLDIEKYQRPLMPKGATVAAPFGQGVSHDGSRYDYYFCHHNLFEVAEFFGLPAPTVPALDAIDKNNSIEKVFGLAYDAKTLKCLKLKRYFYPQDPHLKYILFDEVEKYV